jgi:hypothetical protein
VTDAPELLFAFTFEDAAVRLFRDVFGLRTVMDLEEQGGHGLLLSAPSLTPELIDVRHTDVVHEIEAGGPREAGSGSPCA